MPRQRVVAAAVLLAIASICDGFAPSSTSRAMHQNMLKSALHFWNKKEEEAPAAQDDQDVEEKEENLIAKIAPTIKVALPSFILGGVATLSFLFGPILTDYYDAFEGSASTSNFYSTEPSSKVAKNNINQPVILFETILNDLNEAYVDDVDIQKLFETGVKAMVRKKVFFIVSYVCSYMKPTSYSCYNSMFQTASLDPYTEFESRQEAIDLEESVSGVYGGVGLVIRGSTLTADAEDILLEPVSTDGEKSAKPPIVKNLEDEDRAALKRRKLKSMEDGIRVVSAFEGYAYDAGLRVGDKLLFVDDFEIKPTTTVEQVRNHLRGDPGTPVSITFQREGVGGVKNEPQTIEMQRSVSLCSNCRVKYCYAPNSLILCQCNNLRWCIFLM
jgi:S1-C subfamily serine protease